MPISIGFDNFEILDFETILETYLKCESGTIAENLVEQIELLSPQETVLRHVDLGHHLHRGAHELRTRRHADVRLHREYLPHEVEELV